MARILKIHKHNSQTKAYEISKIIFNHYNNRNIVNFLFDYESSICKNLISGEESKIELPKSNVLIYETTEGTRMAARPSGTEPKIKFYFSVNGALNSVEEAESKEAQLDQKIQDIIAEFKLG